ncbi:MAG: hypothetical protein KIT31_30785 [Deltaproteobacteria bacterium]|nr:hypothetical protein [Deltaproteobacteria bacterium]
MTALVEEPRAVALPGGTRAIDMIDMLLRDRAGMLARVRAGTDLHAVIRTMAATIAVAMVVVGAALGSFRGGVQVGYAAVKMPLVLLGTAALSAPALSAIGAALGRRSRLSSDLALVMTALAFGALLVAACTPLLLLGRAMHIGYHRTILVAVAMFALGGGAALRMVVGELAAARAPGWRSAITGLTIVFTLVAGQLSWALRPYLVRPQSVDVPFLRQVEGSFLDAVPEAIRSARGIYREPAGRSGSAP